MLVAIKRIPKKLLLYISALSVFFVLCFRWIPQYKQGIHLYPSDPDAAESVQTPSSKGRNGQIFNPDRETSEVSTKKISAPTLRKTKGNDEPQSVKPSSVTVRSLVEVQSATNTGAIKSSGRKVVILTTQCRSGSSFTGEILAAGKGTMYLYEPLLPFGMNCSSMEDRKIALLSRILNCNFTNLQPEYAAGFNVSHYPDYGNCVKEGYCFASESTGLLRGYAATCYKRYTPRVPANVRFNVRSKVCGYPLKEDILSEQCTKASVVLTKVTRICSLNQLQRLHDYLSTEGHDVYVIHLVRDPRSTIYSRIKEWRELPTYVARDVCSRLRNNLQILDEIKLEIDGTSNLNMVADGRYLRVRFEDLAMDATGWGTKMFQFIGDDQLPVEATQVIVKKLQQDKKKVEGSLRDKNRLNRLLARRTLVAMNLSYSAVKDSKEVLRKWRELIPWNLVETLQAQCADVMASLGYTPFKTEEMLRNTSIPFFVLPT